MTILKITAIAGSIIVAAGGSAAVATRDKWWPTESVTEDIQTQSENDRGEQETTQPGPTTSVTPESKNPGDQREESGSHSDSADGRRSEERIVQA